MEMDLISIAFRNVAHDQGINTDNMKPVITCGGFAVMTKVEFFDNGVWMLGALSAIGENARKSDGSHFTAFLIAKPDNKLVVKMSEEIRHPIEAGIPADWAEFLHRGWKVVPSSWECGCRFAWLKPRPSGAHEMYGCISHCSPKDELPSKQGEVSTA